MFFASSKTPTRGTLDRSYNHSCILQRDQNCSPGKTSGILESDITAVKCCRLTSVNTGYIVRPAIRLQFQDHRLEIAS